MPLPTRRAIAWGAAAALLALPLVAGAPWTSADYGLAAGMIGVAGGAIELGVRASASPSYRAGAIVAVAAAFLLVWIDAAVGIFGDGDNPASALFLLVIVIAAGGTLLARWRAKGTAGAMRAAAAVQIVTGIVGWSAGWASPAERGAYEAGVAAVLFATLWLIAAALFDRAARQPVAHSRTASPST